MSRFVAVGDIHGCSQTLAKMLEILDLAPGDTLLSTGDLSSKGEDSRGVHEQLVQLEQRGIKLIVLLGNHELMLLALQRLAGAKIDLSGFPESIFRGADVSCLMRSNETWATLKSYGRDVADTRRFWAFRYDDPVKHFEAVAPLLESDEWRLPQDHLDLLSRCKTHYIARNCLFVHSGIRPQYIQMDSAERAVEAQISEDARELCWSREWLGQPPGFPELVVHGHTPLFYLYSFILDTTPWRDSDLVFKSTVYNGALNLDSGVFLDAGHLTAVEIPETGNPSELHFIRVPRLDPVCKDRLSYVNHM
ncbi:metallophosphoesterase [Roseimaritima ulvae]|uniref:Bis(5'-nucleosyl)-tetraphosphatase, symmetrical n=1 Tax=Roseimaritima ulvae TaxID=980254 RepID=A0A5B9QV03_9BACT|nr:metallophosphoesterase [Roseimaritima ulvae]QEG40896.1 Bis(5'-nucleosyl)-tetraphosphatase, symmetrical [Roseimaritima ulvae]